MNPLEQLGAAPPPQFEQRLPVEPLPVMIQCASGHGPDGAGIVMLQIHSLTGVHCAVLPAQYVAEQLIPQLQQAAMQARTGLQLGLQMPAGFG